MSTKISKHLILAVVISIFLWVGFLWIGFLDVNYQYLHFMRGDWFQEGISILFLIPACFVIICCFLAYKNKVVWFCISVVVYILVLVYLLFSLFALSLYTPFFSSYSNDPTNLGKYDQYVNEQVNLLSGHFPAEQPKGAEVKQFFYWYWNGAAPHYCIMIVVSFENENDYLTEKDRLNSLGPPTIAGNENYSAEEHEFDVSILYDDSNQEIISFMFSKNERYLISESITTFDRTRYTDAIFTLT